MSLEVVEVVFLEASAFGFLALGFLLGFFFISSSSSSSDSLALSYIDPNNELAFQPKFASIRFNGVLKWNYMSGSNLYLVYTIYKAINGHEFDRMSQLSDFITFNEQEPFVGVLRDQTFMIKIDYWFEK